MVPSDSFREHPSPPDWPGTENYKLLYNAVEYITYKIYFIFFSCKNFVFEDMFTKRYLIDEALNFP